MNIKYRCDGNKQIYFNFMLTVGYEKFETLIKKNTKPTVLTDIDMFCSINLIFSIVLLLCFVERQLVHKTFIDIYNTLHNNVYSC